MAQSFLSREKNKNKKHLYQNVHRRFIFNSPKLEINLNSINRLTDKLWNDYFHNGKLACNNNKLLIWQQLEISKTCWATCQALKHIEIVISIIKVLEHPMVTKIRSLTVFQRTDYKRAQRKSSQVIEIFYLFY